MEALQKILSDNGVFSSDTSNEEKFHNWMYRIGNIHYSNNVLMDAAFNRVRNPFKDIPLVMEIKR